MPIGYLEVPPVTDSDVLLGTGSTDRADDELAAA